MSEKTHLAAKAERGSRPGSAAIRAFGAMTDAEAGRYSRSRDLPGLIALWPRELADSSPEGGLHILSKLTRALRAERRRALAGHWSYDLNRHLALMDAYKAELGSLRGMNAGLSQKMPGAAPPRSEAATGKVARAVRPLAARPR